MNSANYYVHIQLTKLILTCLDLRNTLLSNQTDVRLLLFHCYIIKIIMSHVFIVTFSFYAFGIRNVFMVMQIKLIVVVVVVVVVFIQITAL